MHSSEALRRRAKELADAAAQEPRPGSRIITAERLTRYAPFAMNELSREHGQPFSASENPDDEAASMFSRFSDTGDADSPDQASFQGGFVAGQKVGREAGFADGMKRGFEAGLAQAARQQRQAEEQAGAGLAQRIEALHTSLQDNFAAVEREAADEVVSLALAIARHALRSTLAVRPDAIVAVVQEALSHLLDDRVRVQLHLNPLDADIVRRDLGDRLAARGCDIIGDAGIMAGGCRISTPRAEIDATVQTRWRRTLAALGRDVDGALEERSA